MARESGRQDLERFLAPLCPGVADAVAGLVLGITATPGALLHR